MGKRRKTWLALNGLEFTPPGADSPVCWPWTQIKVVPKQGFVPLDVNGERAKDARGKTMTVGCKAILRDFGRALKARAMREVLQEGESKRFDCRSRDEYVAGALMIGVSLLGAWAAVSSAPTSGFMLFVCGLAFVSGLILIRIGSQRNVRELAVSTRGVEATLNDGTEVQIPWAEMDPTRGILRGQFRSVNGLVLRYAHNAEIMIAVRASRRKTAGFAAARRSIGKAVRRMVLIVIIPSVLCGAAGALTIYLMGLPPGAAPTPMWVFTRMAGFGVFFACMLPFQIWMSGCIEGSLMPAGVKVYSTAPPPAETDHPTSSPVPGEPIS